MSESYNAEDLWVLAAGVANTPDLDEVWLDLEAAKAEAVQRTTEGGHEYRVVSLREGIYEYAQDVRSER